MKSKNIFQSTIIMVLCFLTVNSFSIQTTIYIDTPKTIVKKDTSIFGIRYEKHPQFPGGDTKLYEYLFQNIKYPQLKKKSSITSKIYVQFFVEKDGSVTNITVIKGINDKFDNHIKDIIKKMPKWTPGEQNGEKIRVQYTVPIRICF